MLVPFADSAFLSFILLTQRSEVTCSGKLLDLTAIHRIL